MSDPHADAVTQSPRPARLRREARTRRRRIAMVVAVLALLVAGTIVLVTRDNKDNSKVSAGSTTTTTARSSTTDTTSTTDNTASSTTVSGRTTGPPATGLALPEANRKAPPDPPVGLYRHGKLRLVGSVPSAAIASRYLRRTQAVLGRANVTMAMQRDPRVPASPLRVIVEEEFRFPTGSFVVDPKYASLLNLGVVALKKLPEARLVVTGYTDNVGAADVNQSLSELRAQVVVDWMVRGGIPASRVLALGRGPADPIATNNTPAGRLKNRRIEATLEGIRP